MMLAAFLEKIRQATGNEACHYCKKPLAIRATESDPRLCKPCLQKLGLRESFPLTTAGQFKLYAATLFTPATKNLLYSYKFYGRQSNRLALTELLAAYWQQLPVVTGNPKRVLVTCIPPHLGRAPIVDAIARPFAARNGYRFSTRLLSWQREVEPQHSLHSRRRRIDNVKNSLLAQNRELYFEPDHIVIVDDLSTTGATLMEACRALKASGVTAPITGLAVAHIPLAFQRQNEVNATGTVPLPAPDAPSGPESVIAG